MNKNKIITAIKRQEEEKVAVSLKLPKSLKEQIQNLADSETVSMNSLIVATLQSMIDDDCGKQLMLAKTILTNLLEDLEEVVQSIEDCGIDGDNAQAYVRHKNKIQQIKEAINN